MALMGDEYLGLAVADDVGHFGAGQMVVDGRQVQADLVRRQKGLDPHGVVVHQHRDAVAILQAQGAQAVGQAVDPFIELAKAHCLTIVCHQRRFFRLRLGNGPESRLGRHRSSLKILCSGVRTDAHGIAL